LFYSRVGKSGRQGRSDLAGQTLWFEAQNTGTAPAHTFTHTVGVIKIPQAGQQSLRIAPVEAGDELFELSRVVVAPFD